MTESEFIGKEPCPACGSRDNLARYSDGHAHCFTFGCGHYEHGEDKPSHKPKERRMAGDLITNGSVKALAKRGISIETTQKFNYQVGTHAGKTVHIEPYYKDGMLTAQKCRTADKDFYAVGDMKGVELFGQQVWPSGGRKIVITEGAIDCLSVSQLQNNKWPTVSLPHGAQSARKSLSQQLEYLNTFEEVILMFDMDEVGQAAAVDCVPLFPAGKCKIASLPLKDANDMLMADRGPEVIQAIWNAKVHRPDGVVSFADVKEAAKKPIEMGLPWFVDNLTKLTFGRRYGEVYALGAGTGIGKTDFLTQQIAYDVQKLDEKVGLFFLEQATSETARRLAGKVGERRFHIPNAGWTPEELDAALDALDNDKVFFYDNFGSTEWDRIADTIRFLTHSEGVRLFYIDHLTALAAAEDDERKALEKIMAAIAMLAKELNVVIMIISHLATPEGTPHEEGGRVMIRHFKGSRAIGFWCYYMFGMERAQQHEDPEMRSVTTFRILKDRYTGNATGETLFFGYDRETGMLYERDAPQAGAEHGFSDETKGKPDF